MKEQLVKYVDLLFAGATDAAEIKQEILQNTLDRYDDLINQGKTPQAAYQLSISGIGDIRELLAGEPKEAASGQTAYTQPPEQKKAKPVWKKILIAIGVFLYILCPVPLFAEGDETGLIGMFVFIALATALMIIAGGDSKQNKSDQPENDSPKAQLNKAIRSVIGAVGLCIYLAVSFLTQAWYITWLIFPIMGAVQGLVKACIDLKEATKNES